MLISVDLCVLLTFTTSTCCDHAKIHVSGSDTDDVVLDAVDEDGVSARIALAMGTTPGASSTPGSNTGKVAAR